MQTAINPATGQVISHHPTLSDEQMMLCIERAQHAYTEWSTMSYAERGAIMHKVAAALRESKATLGQTMTDEMGKTVKEAGPEVEKAAWCAEHYADTAAQYLKDEDISSDASRSFVHYQPLGVTLGVLPWNAPLWVTFRYLAPALMAGNTCVMKHDPHVPECALGIIAAFEKAGAPADIVVNLPVTNGQVAQAIRHPAIKAVSFTGSAKAGATVAALAAAEVKPSVLELGGSDPFIVLADADLDHAADVAVLSRVINVGQSCIAAKRILIEAPIYDDFVARLLSRLKALNVGDPNNAETDVGPIARADLRDNLHRQVTTTIAQGAKCLLGGEMPEGEGFYYPVTLLADVTSEMCAMQQEVFGPVMSVSAVRDAKHAIEVANASAYGLGGGVWTQSAALAIEMAQALEVGQVAINGIVKTDPRLPSGGVKQSGYGRELGEHGIKAFVNAKQIWIK
uniref:NAD-dependent succinate-semialdehyde dehydrogenase n=1 Tax=Thaumasiovibrio occultus TaxID=1891184 RepID=UPI000B34B59D|nr:NAD-dependent succinate-semialdehyde dehydrogenase [Thaumasiovibrio occultus]